MLDRLNQDFRSALRSLRMRPGTSALAVLTLACGLGAATAILGVVHGVLLRALPYPHAEQIIAFNEVAEHGGQMPLARPNADDLIAAQRDFGAIGLYGSGTGSISGGEAVVRGRGTLVDGDFFRVFGVAPMLGRTFGADERERVAVIDHSLWIGLFGGREDLSGMSVDVFGEHLQVIGVMPAGFAFPSATRVWLPADRIAAGNTSRTAHNWQMVGRIKSIDALPAARTAASALAARLRAEYGDEIDATDFALTPLRDRIVAPVRSALWVLGAGALLLLLIASVNTINLLMAMTWSRSRELAIRAALGARARRIARHILLESAILTALATGLGLVGAHFALDFLVRLAGDSLPRADELHLAAGPILAMLGFAILLALVVGLVAARNSVARADAGELRAGGRGVTLGRSQQRLQTGLLVTQAAIAAMLLVGAGLLGRTFLALLAVDPGFRPQGALSVRVSVPPATDAASGTRLANRHEELMRAFAALPGVTAVGGTNALPLTDDGANGSFFPASVASIADFNNSEALGYAEYRVASEGYFAAAGIPLVRGRVFRATDQPDSQPVAIVSRSLAERTWPGRDPIGQALQFGNMDGDLRPLTVVGVVGDVHENGLAAPPRGTIYVDLAQRPQVASEFSVVVRGSAPIAQTGREVRGVMSRIAPDIPYAIAPLAAVQAASLDRNTFALVLFGVFAGVALALTIGGIYGLMAFSVGQRRTEFALRQALGASRGGVARLVLSRGLRIGLAGLLIGLVAALAGARALRSLLFGVAPTDPWTLFGVAVVLLGTLAVACLVPAWRASATAPRSVLD